MILTYKVKHGRDFTVELAKARQVAEFAINHPFNSSSALVRHFNLISTISCQILRKYGRNTRLKTLHRVNLVVSGHKVRYRNCAIYISCLKLNIPFDKQFIKINQVELNNKYAFISVTVPEEKQIIPKTSIGVDLNTTGHCAVIAVKDTGKVYKLGKRAIHTHLKYKNIRKNLQINGYYKKVKKIGHRESRIVRDLNHKISKFIITKAKENQADIKLEKLNGINRARRKSKSFRYALNSWAFYQLQKFIEYKAQLAGISVVYINPAYTSQICSKCGDIGTRSGKEFKCDTCSHVENADVNAAFNIAKISNCNSQLLQDRDWSKGINGLPQEATLLGSMASNYVVAKT